MCKGVIAPPPMIDLCGIDHHVCRTYIFSKGLSCLPER